MTASIAGPSSVRDPLYRQILAGLEGHLDSAVFEAAVCDLLRDSFPSLAPIPGGSDRGMDGAITDGEGEAFPLVCTTDEDVIGNLTKSLSSYRGKGGGRRKVILATSRALTPTRRLNLEERAREKGFTLIQVIEQRGIADRLYRNTHWLKELLGLTPSPSALSAVPMSRRPLVELPLVGREKELEWLRSSSGDRLIVGQPGSGKTFLLSQLVRENGWLFLVSDDEPGIVAALNEQQPAAVIVDDAHANLPRLDLLRHLREERVLELDIVATTWPGEQEAVRSHLGDLAEAQVFTLDLLGRSQIKHLLELLGIRETEVGPELVRELLRQAANKPGLAATLGLVWLRGEWQSLVEGRSIDQALMPLFEERVGSDTRSLLASFAIGGSRGMKLEAVAGFHGLSLPQVWQKVSSLAAGGVLRDLGERELAVEPDILRVALLRTVFFPDVGPALPLAGLLECAHPGSAAEVVAETALRGAKVPIEVLHEVLLRADPREEILRIAPRAWSYAAQISAAEAEWVLEHYPGYVTDVAAAALEKAPETALARLLRAAETAEGEPHSRPSHPLRILSAWVQEPQLADREGPLRRRRFLVAAAKEYLAKGGVSETGVAALLLGLSPKAEGVRDNALGDTATISFGLAPLGTLRGIGDLWRAANESLPPPDAQTWPRLGGFLWDWVRPHIAASIGTLTPEIEAMMKDFARRVLVDLIPQAKGRPGIAAGLQGFARQLGIELPIEADRVFELLYPDALIGRDQGKEKDEQRLTSLAECWSREGPLVVAQRLRAYEDEARVIGRDRWPRHPAELCRRLAELAEDCPSWIDALLTQELPGDLVEPFLARIVRCREAGWEKRARRCLDDQAASRWAVELLLREERLPEPLSSDAMARAPQFADSVETLALRRELPVSTLLALLRHDDGKVALAAAVGEWNAEPQGQVQGPILPAWRAVILRAPPPDHLGGVVSVSSDYWLLEILAKTPDLAVEWWIARSNEGLLPRYRLRDDLIWSTIRPLGSDQRARLLKALSPQPGVEELLPLLVNRNKQLFSLLLTLPDLKEHHLAAMEGMPAEAWADLAALAMASGYSSHEVAAAATWKGLHIIDGSGLGYWQEWDAAFAALESDPRAEVREVAAAGRRLAQEEITRSEEKQRQIELHGW